MGHIYVAVSPCQIPPEERRQVERDYPGIRLPDEGRLASRLDIEAALATHPEWKLDFSSGTGWWTVFVQSPDRSASLHVSKYQGDPSQPQPFAFDTGDPDLVVDIAAAVAERCGSFLVVDESGGIVVLVNQDGSRSDVGQDSAGGSRPARVL